LKEKRSTRMQTAFFIDAVPSVFKNGISGLFD
jgi:hypothetical protein